MKAVLQICCDFDENLHDQVEAGVAQLYILARRSMLPFACLSAVSHACMCVYMHGSGACKTVACTPPAVLLALAW